MRCLIHFVFYTAIVVCSCWQTFIVVAVITTAINIATHVFSWADVYNNQDVIYVWAFSVVISLAIDCLTPSRRRVLMTALKDQEKRHGF